MSERTRSYYIGAATFTAEPLAPALYLVPTPIGNLKDVTLRALEVLAAADVIYCEDTRVTAKLLERYGIRNSLKPCHDHNESRAAAGILAAVTAGKAIALASDAGTPLLSDPGFAVVREAIAHGVRIEALPGASALLPGLQLSALPSDAFTFLGFLPQKKSERRKLLESVKERRETLIAYESPHRIVEALEDTAAVMGSRPLSVSREISKLHEETLRGPSVAIASELSHRATVKGEFVLVIGGATELPQASDEQIDAAITLALKDHSASKAAGLVAKQLNVARDDIYARILKRQGKA
jgi:16S rRNA (cytidine1402-2'-O)-methyltransferase